MSEVQFRRSYKPHGVLSVVKGVATATCSAPIGAPVVVMTVVGAIAHGATYVTWHRSLAEAVIGDSGKRKSRLVAPTPPPTGVEADSGAMAHASPGTGLITMVL